DLDDLDLLVAGAGQHDVHRGGLFLGGSAVAGGTSGSRSGSRDCGRGHAELLLERLDPVRELSDRDALELVDPFLGVGCHQLSPSSFEVSSVVSASAGASASAASASASSAAGSG